jgi:hypothetical protein
MQESATNLRASASSNFASVIASLAKATRSGDSGRTSAQDDAAFVDDTLTLSYEQALRTHVRYHPSAGILPNPQDGPGGQEQPKNSVSPAGPEDSNALASRKSRSAVAQPAMTANQLSTLEESRKTSSITIRLSKADCSQLRARAGEAGLTVSAYLRSCAFEVETLRGQVKEALTQLRQTAPVVQLAAANPAPAGAHSGWRSRIFAHLRRGGPALA